MLIMNDGRLTLGDFGSVGENTLGGPTGFTAPENCKGPAQDVFSWGMTAMCCLCVAFPSQCSPRQYGDGADVVV